MTLASPRTKTVMTTAPEATTPAATARVDLVEELFARYGGGDRRNRWLYLRKRLAWKIAIGGARALKRLFDIVGAAIGILALSPIFAIVALCIKLTDRGPILYVAPRVGKWGREFPFPKFRSMVLNADRLKAELAEKNDHGGKSITFKMKRDPRVTWIGRIIRRLSIDEIPQLWCVLRGHMSLVGPRPPVPSEVRLYTLRDRRRLDVTPGLTCIWQVSGRGEIPFDEQVKLDIQYVESRSLWLDLWLILRTIPAVLLGKGAY